MYVQRETTRFGEVASGRTFRRAKCGGLDASSRGTTLWYDLWDDLWQRSMPAPDAAARHTGAGVARRQAHHERTRDERAREAAAGDAELPPEDETTRSRWPGQRGGGGPELRTVWSTFLL